MDRQGDMGVSLSPLSTPPFRGALPVCDYRCCETFPLSFPWESTGDWGGGGGGNLYIFGCAVLLGL